MRWYSGLSADNQLRRVTVYRVPHPALEAAICAAVRGVTVEFRDAVVGWARSSQIRARIMDGNGGFRQFPGFRILGIGEGLDGVTIVLVDNPAAAKKFLGKYGNAVRVTQSGTSPIHS